MAMYILWVLVWGWEGAREAFMFWSFWANKRDNKEMENINEVENCLGESEQTEVHDVSVLGPNLSFLKTRGCVWYYPKPQGRSL